ncbi:ferritin-like domain-containing protein [Streptomyces sp. NPDC058157]|uniref:ferritin-like domain-containing protein n=1 Tax=Streptomyces sp. NPDC058157 TaxID=3346360 RepID=UPI0036E491EB
METATGGGQPLLHQKGPEIQRFGTVRQLPPVTSVPRPPDGVEPVPVMLSRLLDAHERILVDARDAASRISAEGDEGSNDLLISEVVRTGEAQVWFLAEHLVDTPLVRV